MKKNYKSSVFAYVLAAIILTGMGSSPAYSQSTYQVGSGAEISSGYPVFTSSTAWQYSITAAIFTASELSAAGMTAGDITAISWDYMTGCIATGPLTIYIKHTPDSVFPGGGYPTWLSAVSGATQVYNAATTLAPVSGWVPVSFSSAFTWNGTDNIEVITQFDRQSFTGNGNLTWTGTTLDTAFSRNAFSGGASYPAIFSSFYQQRTNTIFTVGGNVGLAETAAKAGFSVMPNPAKNIITINSREGFDNGRINIMSVSGQVLSATHIAGGKSAQIDISALAAGIYIAEIINAGKIARAKIVVE